jgi:sporulation protein YtfJ
MAGDKEINGLMETALQSLKEMINVNTIIGEMRETPDGAGIIPVSRVSCGYVAGGGEYGQPGPAGMPFSGGSGAGVSLKPIGFLVVKDSDIRLISAENCTAADKLLDSLPLFFDHVQKIIKQYFSEKADGGEII